MHKVLIAMLVVFSMLVMVNSSYAKQNESPIQLEINDKVKKEITKAIVYGVVFQQENVWNLAVEYDLKTNTVIQAVKTDVNDLGAMVRLINGKKAVESR
ncbi:MAG: hypothetical protein K0R55_3527 [Sporomusa sp.]|jgi:hypothetical protein|nr:hypothetical protein [Sporomusa sp.]